MLYYTIGEICEIIGGNAAPKGDNAFSENGIPFLKMKDLGRYHLTNNLIEIENKVDDEVAKKNKLKLIKKGTILLPRSGSVGLNHRAILGIDSYMVSHIFGLSIKDPSKVYNKYLYYYLCTINFNSITKKTTGLDAVNFSDVSKIKIPLPSLTEQKHIAEVLSKAEALIAERKQSIQLLDEYLKSTFLEMFGDDFKSQRNLTPVSNVTKFIDYRGKTLERVEEGVPYISAKCVRKGYFDEDRLDYIDNVVYEKIMTRGFPKPNDVLFTTEGATLGYTCRIPRNFTTKFSVGQRIITLQCSSELKAEYLEYALNHSETQKRIFKRISGSAALGIRSSEFSEVEIPIPQIKLQTQFASIVEKTEALKAQYKEHLQSLEQMYGALSQRAFRGGGWQLH